MAVSDWVPAVYQITVRRTSMAVSDWVPAVYQITVRRFLK